MVSPWAKHMHFHIFQQKNKGYLPGIFENRSSKSNEILKQNFMAFNF